MQMTITRETEAGYDDNHQWQEGGQKVIATAEGSIQPQSGEQRAYKTKTEYESQYIAYIKKENLIFEDGFDSIEENDIVNEKYEVVFPGEWPNSYQVELKHYES